MGYLLEKSIYTYDPCEDPYLVEFTSPMEWELDVTAELSAIGIAKGWGAIFNSNGRFMIYSNTKETNIIDLKTMKHHWVDWSGKR